MTCRKLCIQDRWPVSYNCIFFSMTNIKSQGGFKRPGAEAQFPQKTTFLPNRHCDESQNLLKRISLLKTFVEKRGKWQLQSIRWILSRTSDLSPGIPGVTGIVATRWSPTLVEGNMSPVLLRTFSPPHVMGGRPQWMWLRWNVHSSGWKRSRGIKYFQGFPWRFLDNDT